MSRRGRISFALACLLPLALACSSKTHDVDCMQGIEPSASGFYGPEQLPHGACNDEGAVCRMGVGYKCHTTVCPVNGEQCRCENGAWRCFVEFQGMCGCGEPIDAAPPLDASPPSDASPASVAADAADSSAAGS